VNTHRADAAPETEVSKVISDQSWHMVNQTVNPMQVDEAKHSSSQDSKSLPEIANSSFPPKLIPGFS